jgi:O-antigen ligase
MSNLIRYLLWLYAFTVAWDTVSLPLVGSVSRALGLAVVGAAVVMTMVTGRFRKPDAILGFATAFGVWCALSLMWTISNEDTVASAFRFAQLIASLWVIREFIRTREQVQTLLTAFFLGLFVPLLDLLNNFRTGVEIREGTNRYSGSNFNADMVGFSMAIGLPIAWHLFRHSRGVVARVLSLIFLAAAPLALVLSGTRGAFVVAVVALSIIPTDFPRASVRSYALTGALVLLGALLLTQVPQANWERMLTIKNEVVEGGSMNGRSAIWRAGLQAFQDRPLMGAGPGTFTDAIQPYYRNTRRRIYSHNLAIGMLVEEGIVGFVLFTAILVACAWTIFRLPRPDRALWGVLLLTWLFGNLSISLELSKLSYVLFGLVAGQSGQSETFGNLASMKGLNTTAMALSRPPALPRTVRTLTGR